MSNETQNAKFVEALNKLKQSFLDRVPGELESIAEEFNKIKPNQPASEIIEVLRQKFHKLAGSSGTFGLNDLGKLAKLVEQKLKSWQKEGRDQLNESELNDLFKELEKLRQASETSDQTATFSMQKAFSREIDDIVELWLVEDDELLAQELQRQFDTFGYNTKVFRNLADADSVAENHRPDALILDVIFDDGKQNSTEAFAQTQHLSQLNCPIIFMSAYDDFASRVRAVQLRAKGYFLKPISVPAVVNHLKRVFDLGSIPNARILIVEDDEELAKHFQLVLGAAGFDAECLFETEKIIETIAQFNPEVVLMDLHMPKYNGMELAGVIRQHAHWMSLPIVYLSAETDLDAQSDALEKGAEDFLTKPISDVQLVSTVRARVIRSRQLEEKISRDSLTGLLKHAVIKEAVRHEVARSLRTNKPCCVVMLDIDHFKSVNDNYGHAVGDVVISAVATVLQQRLRKTDILGRYGGEEFVVVLPECNAKEAFTIIDNIRQAFNKIEFQHEKTVFFCSYSAGIVCTVDNDSLDGEKVLIEADANLYEAKKSGRNRVVVTAGEQ